MQPAIVVRDIAIGMARQNTLHLWRSLHDIVAREKRREVREVINRVMIMLKSVKRFARILSA